MRLAIRVTGYLGSLLALAVLGIYTLGMIYAASMLWWRPDMLIFWPFALGLMASAVLGAVAASVVDTHHRASIWAFIGAMLSAAFALHAGAYLVGAPWLLALLLTVLYRPDPTANNTGTVGSTFLWNAAMLLRRIIPS